jgi:hypothetical protein
VSQLSVKALICGFTRHKAMAMMKNMVEKLRAPPGERMKK